MHTLRARLTFLYVLVTGGMFLLFGAAVYGLVGVLLMRQIDRTLIETGTALIQRVKVRDVQHPEVSMPPDLVVTSSVVVQMWDREGRRVPLPGSRNFQSGPLSPRGFSVNRPTLFTEHQQGQAWRVLVEPIFFAGRRVGTLEVGLSLTAVRQARQAVLVALVSVTLLAMLLAALVVYFSVGVALEPLAHATALADQITHAGDLSRRIPVPRGAGDEVWTLVQAFNATLARLEALFQAQRRFIADVGHELRTPLTVIKGNAQWMRRIGQLDTEALDSIEEETDRLGRLVEDLLLLARVEAGKLPLRREAVALDAVLADVLREMQVMARQKGVALEVRVAQPVQVEGDPDRLKQVFINLVGNAVKYTPRGGRVTLTLNAEKGWAVCRVEDTGPGIAPEDLPHVFERFYRADKARSRGQGFGLGLSIAYWIVKHHGGRIEVASTIGKGTTFTVYLPVAGRDAADFAD